MDIAAKAVVAAQLLRHQDHLLHGVVGRADDARGEKQALDIVALVELDRERHHLVDGELRPLHVGRAPIDAIGAVEQAVIGEQDLEQGYAAPVRRVGVADAGSHRRTQAAHIRLALGRAGGGAGGIVFRRVRQDAQLPAKLLVHGSSAQLFSFCSSMKMGRWRGPGKGREVARPARWTSGDGLAIRL